MVVDGGYCSMYNGGRMFNKVLKEDTVLLKSLQQGVKVIDSNVVGRLIVSGPNQWETLSENCLHPGKFGKTD